MLRKLYEDVLTEGSKGEASARKEPEGVRELELVDIEHEGDLNRFMSRLNKYRIQVISVDADYMTDDGEGGRAEVWVPRDKRAAFDKDVLGITAVKKDSGKDKKEKPVKAKAGKKEEKKTAFIRSGQDDDPMYKKVTVSVDGKTVAENGNLYPDEVSDAIRSFRKEYEAKGYVVSSW